MPHVSECRQPQTILYSICAYNTDICVVSRGIYHGYRPVDIRGICHGIQRRYPCYRHKYYIRGIKARGYPQISVVYNPRILARILAHSPWTPLHRRHMQNTFVNTTWSRTNPKRAFFRRASSKLSTTMEHLGTYRCSTGSQSFR